MTEETYRIPPQVEKCNDLRENPMMQSNNPDPIVPPTLTPETPTPPKVLPPDEEVAPTGEKPNIPENVSQKIIPTEYLKPASPMLRRSTRERRKPDFYGERVPDK